MELYETFWNFLDLYEVLRIYMELCRPFWIFMDLFGSFWNSIGLLKHVVKGGSFGSMGPWVCGYLGMCVSGRQTLETQFTMTMDIKVFSIDE